MHAKPWVTTGLLISVAAFAQTTPPEPEFEVATIKPSAPPSMGQVNVGVHVDGAQVRITYRSLQEYISSAYRLKVYQVVGPDWLASQRFDVSAKLPEGAQQDQVPAMLRSLLADRFHMKAHRETREFPVYGLVVAKGGPKMKEVPPDPAAAGGAPGRGAINVTASGGRGGTVINYGNGATFSMGNEKFEGRKLNMTVLADALGRFIDRPVVDMTELKGNYDFTMEMSEQDFRAMMIRAALSAGVPLPPEAARLMESAAGDSLLTAVQSLGLKLEPRKAPLEVLVVDQMEKTPVDN